MPPRSSRSTAADAAKKKADAAKKKADDAAAKKKAADDAAAAQRRAGKQPAKQPAAGASTSGQRLLTSQRARESPEEAAGRLLADNAHKKVIMDLLRNNQRFERFHIWYNATRMELKAVIKTHKLDTPGYMRRAADPTKVEWTRRTSLAARLALSDVPTPVVHANLVLAEGATAKSHEDRVLAYAYKFGAIGTIVSHDEMYEPAVMRFVRDPTSNEITQVFPVYGAMRTQPSGLPVFMSDKQVRLYLAVASIFDDIPIPEWYGDDRHAWRSKWSKPWGNDRFEANEIDLEMLYDKISLEKYTKPTLAWFSESAVNHRMLRWDHYSATLMASEAFSAGCVRCLRQFYEPPGLWVVDAYRTTLLIDAFRGLHLMDQTMVQLRARVLQIDPHLKVLVEASFKRGAAVQDDDDDNNAAGLDGSEDDAEDIGALDQPLIDDDDDAADDDEDALGAGLQKKKRPAKKKKDGTPRKRQKNVTALTATAPLELDKHLSRAEVFGRDILDHPSDPNYSYKLKPRIIFNSDEYVDGEIKLFNVNGRLTVATFVPNPNPVQLKEVVSFGASPSAWKRTYKARATTHEKDLPRVKLYRYYSARAASNLCVECGRMLSATKVGKLLDGYRPMELSVDAFTAQKAAKKMNNLGLRAQTGETPVTDFLSSGSVDAMKDLHERLVADGLAKAYVPPKQVQISRPKDPAGLLHTITLPTSYVSWARDWGRKHPSAAAPPFDLNTLLRMGLITPTEYAEALKRNAPAARSVQNARCDVTIGDVRTGLLVPLTDERSTKAKHKTVLEQVEALLTGQPVAALSYELFEALQQLKSTHATRLQRLNDKDKNLIFVDDPTAPGYEWMRVVKHEKKRWHPACTWINDERKQKTRVQWRSVQQSKFMFTFVLHRRATYNEQHSEHILSMMAGAARRLFSDPEELSRCFKFGVNWNSKLNGWRNWVPKKAGAETTGVGHYDSVDTGFNRKSYFDTLKALNPELNDKELNTLTAKFCTPTAPYTLKALKDHPYRNIAKGPLFLPDEYMSDLYEDVVVSVHADVGCEIGPVARLFHFHMLLDTKHLSKLQVDTNVMQLYFLSCWMGLKYGGQYTMKDPSGRLWISPNEKPHMKLDLLGTDHVAVVMDAYVKKQSTGFFQAGLQAMRKQMELNAAAAKTGSPREYYASHAGAMTGQPRSRDAIVSINDGIDTGLQNRAQELYARAAGQPLASGGQVPNAAGVDRSSVVGAPRLAAAAPRAPGAGPSSG